MLNHEYTYAYGEVDICTGEPGSLILPHVNTGCMQLFRYGSLGASPRLKCIVMVKVMGEAGWQRSA